MQKNDKILYRKFPKVRVKRMRATGIVRRIDELGRIVIPKEIRRSMRIREGDPLEIYTDEDGKVVFKKYSMVGEMAQYVGPYSEIIGKLSPLPVIFTDTERILAVSHLAKRELIDKRITYRLEKAIAERSLYIEKNDGGKKIEVTEGLDRYAAAIIPIVSRGDVFGSVVFLEGENGVGATDAEIKLAQSAADFIGRQTEV